MTASEFAHLVNTPYPTVAQWLRDGRVPGAEMQEIGNLKVWLIPKDVLKDFKRPEMGRPKKTAENSDDVLPSEPPASTARPTRRARAKNAAKKTASKKGGAAK